MRSIWIYFLIFIVVNLIKNSGNAKRSQHERKRTASAPRSRRVSIDPMKQFKRGIEKIDTLFKELEHKEEADYSVGGSREKAYPEKDYSVDNRVLDFTDYEKPSKIDDKVSLEVDSIEEDGGFDLSMSDLQKAIVMSEILDKPVSLRK